MQNDQEILTPMAMGLNAHQFASAGYAQIRGAGRCRICHRSIFDSYYRVNNLVACSKCAGESRQGLPSDSQAAFRRGLLLGMVAAGLGVILYATFTIASSFCFGFMALGVGWLVAKAILIGSNGIGGRRYQIAAVLLTYIAISTSAIPVKVVTTLKHYKATAAQHNPVNSAENGPSPQDTSRPRIGLRGIALKLLVLGLASPLMDLHDPFRGLVSMIILLVGLRIAYRLAEGRPLDVDGPFRATAS